jgi:hypothetical protein
VPTGAEARLDYNQTPVELSPAERAWAHLRQLQQHHRDLPGVMREAAAAGRFEAVERLRLEFEQMPVKLWSAEYTAVQAELASGNRDRRTELRERARELASELYRRPAWPGLTPGQ